MPAEQDPRNRADRPNRPNTEERLIPPHGGYRDLKSYQNAETVYDATVAFCDRFIDKRSRTHDQMVQAARSGKQNIVEGNMTSGTSRKTEIKLIGVARGSLEELLQDYEDFLRQRKLALWGKDDPRAKAVRALAYLPSRQPTPSSASSTRQTTSWTSRCANSTAGSLRRAA